MKDFAEKPMVETISGTPENEKWYPRLKVTVEQLPEIFSKPVGSICELKVKVKIKEISDMGKKGKEACMDIVAGEYYKESEERDEDWENTSESGVQTISSGEGYN